MKANTATLFVCSGAALGLLVSGRAERLARALALLVVLVGALTLTEYIFSWHLGIDELLVSDTGAPVATISPGRMGPNTALSFVLAGLSLLTLFSAWRGFNPPSIGALAIGVIAITSLIGYLFGVPRAEKLLITANLTPMAVHTALLMILFAAGLVLANPKTGIVASLRGPGPGGMLLRRLLLPAILLPLGIGSLMIIGLDHELFGTREATALFASMLAIALGGAVWLTAKVVDRAEAARIDSLARERAVLETALDGVVTIDSMGLILDANVAIEEMFGLARQELIGRDLAACVMPERLHEAHRAGLARATADPESFRNLRLETTGRHSDGREFPVEVSIGRPAQSGPVTFIGNIRDISERRKLEDELRQAQKLEAVGQLAGGIAHDFNNLLTVITGYGSIAREMIGDAPGAAELALVHESTERATELVRHLLAFSRQQVLAPVTLELEEVASSLMPVIVPLIGEDIKVELLTEDGSTSVFADRSQIEQVMINLAVNARDAMPTGGKLTFEIRSFELDTHYSDKHLNIDPGKYVCMRISDTGTGIAPEVVEHIFEPFFTTKEVGHGTGLGLATVYGIITQSGGDVHVYSELGMGTTFKVYLPMTGERKETPEGGPAVGAESLSGSETILVCEDEESVRGLIELILRTAGYSVVSAADPNEAIELAAERLDEIDALLSDVIMPEMSGPQLAQRLQEMRGEPTIPVLLVSGYTADTVRDRGSLPAGSAYVEKPFDQATLLRSLRDLLDNRPADPRV